MKEIFAEGYAEGHAEGIIIAKSEMAHSLAETKMSIDEIAQIAKVSIETVKEWLSDESFIAG